MIENGLPVDIIYTDFAKAFDRVPHQRLLQKLMHIGITGNTLRWIESFLNERSQCVRVENELSSWSKVKSKKWDTPRLSPWANFIRNFYQ